MVEDNFAVLVMILTSWYALFFCRGFKLTGPFVIMIYRMMAADLLRFVIIYLIFVMGFAQCKTKNISKMPYFISLIGTVLYHI